MKVELIQMTENPIDVMWTAARTCYNPGSPIDMWDDRYQTNIELTEDESIDNYIMKQNKMWNLVKKVLDSGHQSIAEHVYFTFAIEGISRSCSHQLVRHRHCTFSQQSQRYVEIKEDYDELLEHTRFYGYGACFLVEEWNDSYNKISKILEKYFVDVNPENIAGYFNSLLNYLNAINNNLKPEDARQFLPNATKTNIVMSCNYRELIHMCNLRLCSRAQKEIRDLFREIVNCISDERIKSYLVPQCEMLGFCPEDKCCGRKSKLEKLNELTKLSQEYGLYEESEENQ